MTVRHYRKENRRYENNIFYEQHNDDMQYDGQCYGYVLRYGLLCEME